MVIVTGHGADAVEEYWSEARPPLTANFLHNESYADLNNFHTVGLACERCEPGDLLILNSDIVFLPSVIEATATTGGDLTLAVDETQIDEEALGVRVEADQVMELGKHLTPEESLGEFVGVSILSPSAREAYLGAARSALDGGEADLYYEDVYSRICPSLDSRVNVVAAEEWAEIDVQEDVPGAEKVAARQDALRLSAAGTSG